MCVSIVTTQTGRGAGVRSTRIWRGCGTGGLGSGWRIVDVAAGTALFARATAAPVGLIVAVDLTPEMLTRAFSQAGARVVEMARVCRADRQLVLVDMVADALRHWA